MNITIGTVIHGTLRDEDLLEAFADELERVAPDGANVELISEAREGEPATGNAQDTIGDLIDELNVYAPPHVYFGAHVGDGADFGWWPVEDFDCETVEIESPGPLDDNRTLHDLDCNILIHENDHGNVTVSTPVCDGENHRANGTNLCEVGVCLVAGPEIWSAV